MIRPKLLDLFCGGGGAAMGYYRAGFDITGVDNKPQPYYPFKFIQADVFEYMESRGHEYDIFHASPPCQLFTTITPNPEGHPDLIAKTREYIQARGKPYIIENVPGAPLIQPFVMLCGTMFDLLVIRHRHFECFPPILFAPRACRHERPVVKCGRRPDRNKHYHSVVGHFSDIEFAKVAMGMNWGTAKELAQAVPPAFTQWVGEQMISGFLR